VDLENVHVGFRICTDGGCRHDAGFCEKKFRRAAFSNDKRRDADDNSFRNGAVGTKKKRRNENGGLPPGPRVILLAH